MTSFSLLDHNREDIAAAERGTLASHNEHASQQQNECQSVIHEGSELAYNDAISQNSLSDERLLLTHMDIRRVGALASALAKQGP